MHMPFFQNLHFVPNLHSLVLPLLRSSPHSAWPLVSAAKELAKSSRAGDVVFFCHGLGLSKKSVNESLFAMRATL